LPSSHITLSFVVATFCSSSRLLQALSPSTCTDFLLLSLSSITNVCVCKCACISCSSCSRSLSLFLSRKRVQNCCRREDCCVYVCSCRALGVLPLLLPFNLSRWFVALLLGHRSWVRIQTPWFSHLRPPPLGTKQLPCKDRSKEEGGREAAVVLVVAAVVVAGSRYLKVTLIMVN
jgi:hypothetical protein